jgi:hypothetical protein
MSQQPHSCILVASANITANPLWRNWLARLTVNQEVGSSSLPGGDAKLKFLFLSAKPIFLFRFCEC